MRLVLYSEWPLWCCWETYEGWCLQGNLWLLLFVSRFWDWALFSTSTNRPVRTFFINLGSPEIPCIHLYRTKTDNFSIGFAASELSGMTEVHDWSEWPEWMSVLLCLFRKMSQGHLDLSMEECQGAYRKSGTVKEGQTRYEQAEGPVGAGKKGIPCAMFVATIPCHPSQVTFHTRKWRS